MAAANVAAPLVAALESTGATLLAQDKAALEAFVEPLADADANAVVGAIAAHVQLGGLAGMIAPAMRNALTGSEPAIDNVINTNVDGGFDALEALLTRLAGGTPLA